VHSEVELGDPGVECGDLAAEPLGALGRSRLQRERAEALAHLGLEVACTLDLHGYPRKLQLGAVPTPLEAAETGRLLEQGPALLGLAREDLLDAPLADDL